MSTEARVTRMEQALTSLAEAQAHTQRQLDQLSSEMREFKSEMREFKNEMREFKDEQRASGARMDRHLGELSNRMGRLVEDIVAPSIPEIMRQRFGIEELELSAPRLRRRHRLLPGRSREFDYVAMAGNLVLINETKSTLRPEDIPRFIEMLGEIRDYLPEADGREVVGSLASFVMDPSLVTAGEREGLLMLGLGTGLLEVLNTPDFEPRRF